MSQLPLTHGARRSLDDAFLHVLSLWVSCRSLLTHTHDTAYRFLYASFVTHSPFIHGHGTYVHTHNRSPCAPYQVQIVSYVNNNIVVPSLSEKDLLYNVASNHYVRRDTPCSEIGV